MKANVFSTSTQCFMLQHLNSSTQLTEEAPAACYRASVVSLESLHHLQVGSQTLVFRFYAHSYLGQAYLASQSSGILWLGAGGIWLSALMMVFLPVEMRNRQMF